MTGEWSSGLGPYQPVIRDDIKFRKDAQDEKDKKTQPTGKARTKLYGRGAADDGYAVFASIIAIKAAQAQKLPLPRCLLLIEMCEESGSPDLADYLAVLQGEVAMPLADETRSVASSSSSDHEVQRALESVRDTLRTAPRQDVVVPSSQESKCAPHAKLGAAGPDVVICLDSGCGNYDQLWLTNTLRGMLIGELQVGVLKGSVHSGDAGGIVPTPLDVARQLLDRLVDARTGRVLVPECHVEIPAASIEFAQRSSAILGADLVARFPWVDGFVLPPSHSDLAECLLNKTWRPAVSCIGLDGIPGVSQSSTTIQGACFWFLFFLRSMS